MENMLDLLKVRMKIGINLAIRDTRSSDHYVILTMDHQKLKTRVVKDTCNPEWNDGLTLSVIDPNAPINLLCSGMDENAVGTCDELIFTPITLGLGLKSLVLESSESSRTTRFALTLWTNAWRALDAVGIASSLR